MKKRRLLCEGRHFDARVPALRRRSPRARLGYARLGLHAKPPSAAKTTPPSAGRRGRGQSRLPWRRGEAGCVTVLSTLREMMGFTRGVVKKDCDR